eukprot:GHRR01033928.1.p1 GENE.GHRR01033928.1~~GHRR01033928.1.p1  ORF type:complete len:122 (-),score=6.84 GHRR01033928.1:943-1308(-)
MILGLAVLGQCSKRHKYSICNMLCELPFTSLTTQIHPCTTASAATAAIAICCGTTTKLHLWTPLAMRLILWSPLRALLAAVLQERTASKIPGPDEDLSCTRRSIAVDTAPLHRQRHIAVCV